MPAQIIAIPKAIMQQRGWKVPPDDTLGLRAAMDALSLHLYGCVAALVPTSDHAILLDGMAKLLKRLDANKQGRAS